MTPNEIIAHDIIVSICIFSLLTYDRIFDENLEHDTYGVKSSTKQFAGFQYQVWPLMFMLVFLYLCHILSSYDNIFETETWCFWSNVKVF